MRYGYALNYSWSVVRHPDNHVLTSPTQTVSASPFVHFWQWRSSVPDGKVLFFCNDPRETFSRTNPDDRSDPSTCREQLDSRNASTRRVNSAGRWLIYDRGLHPAKTCYRLSNDRRSDNTRKIRIFPSEGISTYHYLNVGLKYANRIPIPDHEPDPNPQQVFYV